MARTLKRFETEAEFEEWVNSPDMRTPYTCLVTQTGAVHYDEGSDDDYSVTLVSDVNGWVRFCGANCAPQSKKKLINGALRTVQTYSGREDRGFWNGKEVWVTVYKNGVEVPFENMRGTYYEGSNGRRYYLTKKCRDVRKNSRGYRKYYGHHGNGRYKRYIEVKKGDVIKLVFDQSYIYKGGFSDISFAKEIIIGDGITLVGDCAFLSKNFKEGTKIYIGKNVKTARYNSFMSKSGAKHYAKIFVSQLNRELQLSIQNTRENYLSDSSKKYFN